MAQILSGRSSITGSNNPEHSRDLYKESLVSGDLCGSAFMLSDIEINWQLNTWNINLIEDFCDDAFIFAFIRH